MELDRAYELLKLQFGASIEEVKRAYHSEAILNHPDQHQFDNEFYKMRAEERFKDINEAYHTILEAQQDLHILEHSPSSNAPTFKTRTQKHQYDEFLASEFKRTSKNRNNAKFFWGISFITPLAILISFDSTTWRDVAICMSIYTLIVCALWFFRDYLG